MNQPDLINKILSFPIFQEIPLEQIEWIVERGEFIVFKSGEQIFKRGDSIDRLMVMIDGLVSLKIQQGGQYKELAQIKTGEISGALPYSRAQSATGNAFAVSESSVFTLHKDHFKDLICECHELTALLVHLMTDRVRDFSRFQHQNEKLMALGKLSAGLAHELNNPAAAIVRSAESLQKHLGTVPDKLKRVISINIDDDQIDYVNQLVFGKLHNGIIKTQSMLARAEREDELTDWLEDNGYGDCYMLAETLADYQFEASDLDGLKETMGDKEFPSVLEWVDNVLTTEKMVGEIKDASNRISTLVNSVKNYSHMDRAGDYEPTDIHEGLRVTLSILNHKVKKNQVKVEEQWAANLPKIEASPGVLNQVWTNIIDNALDAMEDKGGTLTIKTALVGEQVSVAITDSGKGIPQEIQDRIFEPFFTTKDIGKGTGLGLETVQRIIEDHKGLMSLESEPGKTTFEFRLPINHQ
ncbi:ATP-binding protein [Roseivirga sp.]|uniref:ATP-binding protein n=1 Tax=Roseivirga sp. TaxID=1964215 RepID=UPI003B52D039